MSDSKRPWITQDQKACWQNEVHKNYTRVRYHRIYFVDGPYKVGKTTLINVVNNKSNNKFMIYENGFAHKIVSNILLMKGFHNSQYDYIPRTIVGYLVHFHVTAEADIIQQRIFEATKKMMNIKTIEKKISTYYEAFEMLKVKPGGERERLQKIITIDNNGTIGSAATKIIQTIAKLQVE